MPSILIMLSGGLDSTAMTWSLLNDIGYSDWNFHIHHMNLINLEDRHRAESLAVDNIVQWLRNQGYKFDYTSSSLQAPKLRSGFMRDADASNFISGYICSMTPRIKKIAIGMQAQDADASVQTRIIRGNKILNAFTDGKVEKIYPVINKTKIELFESLPQELRELFWSCRRPRYDDIITACGRCATCQQLELAGITHPVIS